MNFMNLMYVCGVNTFIKQSVHKPILLVQDRLDYIQGLTDLKNISNIENV